MSLDCSYSVNLMSLSYVVRGYLQSFIAGLVCEDVNGKANEYDTWTIVFLTIPASKMNKTQL